jgi:hypothetical protein
MTERTRDMVLAVCPKFQVIADRTSCVRGEGTNQEAEEFMQDDCEPLLTVKQVATRLNLHEKVVYRLISRRVFQDCLVQIGTARVIRFDRRKIEQRIEEGRFQGDRTT